MRWIGFLLLTPALSYANICGTDYQNFNPLTSGLDFITVQSSETLQPCYLNLGLFINYSRNTLTYTETSGSNQAGDKLLDSMWSSDFNIGVGINERWDAGISFPAVLRTHVEDPTFASYFSESGLTEVRLNTKYRFKGEERGGFAVVATLNINTIRDNPYAGSNPGPTLGLELVADTVLDDVWALAGNVGYRKRNPGDSLPGVPITPVKDQLTYSAALNRYLEGWDSKVVWEIFGAQALDSDNTSAQRSQSSLETLLGLKKDLRKEVSVHFGGGTSLMEGTASPEWRVYAGLNWSFDLCDTSSSAKNLWSESSQSIEKTTFRFKAEILFDFDKDTLKSHGEDQLNKLAEELKRRGYKSIIVAGHTDSIGSRVYNQDLSERRARRVMNYLVKKGGVKSKSITSVGYGEARPIADNSNVQGRRSNRRVEFEIQRK